MQSVSDIIRWLETRAPLELAEDWDNVGLLVGDPGDSVERIMTCLTVTPESVAEAVSAAAQLVIAHHPLPFRPLKRLTVEATPGRLLWQLARAGIAVYSAHTAFDSAVHGINDQLAKGLELRDVVPLRVPPREPDATGSGRWGRLKSPLSLRALAERLKGFLGLGVLEAVGDADRVVETVAVACGSAGEFLEDAVRTRCHVLVTGETSFHTYLEAQARDVALLLPGHFASERFAMERLAEELTEHWPSCHAWAATSERDPLERW